jgi:hypothetical protein
MMHLGVIQYVIYLADKVPFVVKLSKSPIIIFTFFPLSSLYNVPVLN